MTFRHHPDGYIYLGSFFCTLDEFREHFPEYALPEGIIGREYRPEAVPPHVLFDALGNQTAGPFPWPEGDEYLQDAALVQAAIEVARLPAALAFSQKKERRLRAVDQKTQELIDAGFSFAGQTFSLSSDAQINWTNMFIAKTLLSFPLEISTRDSGTHTIADGDVVTNFYATGIAAVNAHLDSGRSIKQQLIQAQTQEELDAVVDGRS